MTNITPIAVSRDFRYDAWRDQREACLRVCTRARAFSSWLFLATETALGSPSVSRRQKTQSPEVACAGARAGTGGEPHIDTPAAKASRRQKASPTSRARYPPRTSPERHTERRTGRYQCSRVCAARGPCGIRFYPGARRGARPPVGDASRVRRPCGERNLAGASGGLRGSWLGWSLMAATSRSRSAPTASRARSSHAFSRAPLVRRLPRLSANLTPESAAAPSAAPARRTSLPPALRPSRSPDLWRRQQLASSPGIKIVEGTMDRRFVHRALWLRAAFHAGRCIACCRRSPTFAISTRPSARTRFVVALELPDAQAASLRVPGLSDRD